MAGVFLSYDRADVEFARPIATALEKSGHSVWWDRHIKGGAQYSKEIDKALRAADAVVVLWSERSIESAWVRDEAAAGRDSGRLVPVSLDDTGPPLGFRQYQTIGLSNWKGSGKPPRLAEILTAIDSLTGEDPQRPARVKLANATLRRGLVRTVALAFVTAVVVAGITLIYAFTDRGSNSDVPVVAVIAADTSPPSQSLADDMFIKLGTLQSTNASALQLVEQDSAAEPDLTFRVAQRSIDGQVQATVALIGPDDTGLLWSGEFWQEKRPIADLRPQIAYSIALVLKCATEGMAPAHKKLEDTTLKLYLVGCARLSEKDVDPEPLVEIFAKIAQQAPDFEGGWAKLLIAETNAFRAAQDPVIGRSLRAHIKQARKLNPTMAEAFVAESWLYDTGQINKWMALAAEAVSKNPTNVWALTEQANDMYQVGRLQQGVAYARRAVQADPLSPDVRVALIIALANAGEIEAAKEALNKAERLWPGASNINSARFFLMATFDDPRQALRLLRSGVVSRQKMTPAIESLLEARIDPSPAKVDRAVEEARAVSERWFEHYAETLAEFGRKEELIKALFEHDPGTEIGPAQVFRPKFRFVQNDARFMAIMTRWGSQLDYWRTSGHWPDFCFRPDLPYDCKAEAAKLVG